MKVLTLMLLCISVHNDIASADDADLLPEFDYVMFALGWPTKLRYDFTVQGLWPKRYGEEGQTGPEYCDLDDPFNATQVLYWSKNMLSKKA